MSLIFILLLQILFCQFFENGNRYKVEIFRVNSFFNEISNNVSHFDVAQNFIISTCLSKVLTINFLEE